MFKKILIANRGEIAIRIIKTCKKLGIKPIVVYSDIDEDALFVKNADEKYCLGSEKQNLSYLNMEKIIKIAKESSTDAIHPGYGFLAENPDFIKRCEEEDIVFIGPKTNSINKLKPKHKAIQLMVSNSIPTIPNSNRIVRDIEDAIEIAEEISYPIILKPSYGGGGIGMKIVNNIDELKIAFEQAESLSKSAFGIPNIYIEKYLQDARHIEVQILADKNNVLHLFERECSIQRRHQKILEECPSIAIDDELRGEICNTAMKIAKITNYTNALTVEFLLSEGKFYFLECNPRIQVEHPITEAITNIDIVEQQIRIACDEGISFSQNELKINGSAIECRINAEDPITFLPSAEKITKYSIPSGEGIRVDNGVYEGYVIPLYYDSLIAKLICHAENRENTIKRTLNALDNYFINGIRTNIPLHKVILRNEKFKDGKYNTKFLENSEIYKEVENEVMKENLLKKLSIGGWNEY